MAERDQKLRAAARPLFGQQRAPIPMSAVLREVHGLLADVARSFAVGSDALVVGPPGCGKSAVATAAAQLLGYAPGATEHVTESARACS